MANSENSRNYRTVEDLDRAARAIAEYFETDAVVVVGSQAALVGWTSAPQGMRYTPEIDVYPVTGPDWNGALIAPSSEHINANFGEGSQFDSEHGFYIDGVGPETSSFPAGWERRAIFREVQSYDGKIVTIIAPSTEDLVIAKSIRLAEKDIRFFFSLHNARPLNIPLILELLNTVTKATAEEVERAMTFFKNMPERSEKVIPPMATFPLPTCPSETHSGSLSRDGVYIVRERDTRSGLYIKIGNTLGPAVVTKTDQKWFLHGKQMPEHEWSAHPEVQEARAKIASSVPAGGLKA